jgi:hypothetical protein
VACSVFQDYIAGETVLIFNTVWRFGVLMSFRFQLPGFLFKAIAVALLQAVIVAGELLYRDPIAVFVCMATAAGCRKARQHKAKETHGEKFFHKQTPFC